MLNIDGVMGACIFALCVFCLAAFAAGALVGWVIWG